MVRPMSDEAWDDAPWGKAPGMWDAFGEGLRVGMERAINMRPRCPDCGVTLFGAHCYACLFAPDVLRASLRRLPPLIITREQWN